MQGFIHLLAFAFAARHRGFAGAARELGVTPSTVAKRIVHLEQELGIKLFHRTTRQVTLTSDGAALFRRCERILADLDEFALQAAGAAGEPAGELRINIPITYGKRVVLPALSTLLRRYPGLTADVRLSDMQCDLVREGMDAAVRIMHLADSSLACRQVGQQHLVLCASPDYLARHPGISHPSQLGAHSFIVFRNPTSGRERPIQVQVDGAPGDLHPTRRLLLDDGEAMAQAALDGVGLIQVPDYIAADYLATGALQEVLQPFRPPPLPIHVIWPGNRLMPARLRVFIDTLAGHASRHDFLARPA